MGRRQLALTVLIGVILFSANTFVMEAYAMTKADLIASISEKTSGKTIRSHGAQCSVIDSDGNVLGSDDSNRAGIIHVKLRSSDGNLPTPLTLSCEKPGLAGTTTFEIKHKRFIKASLTMEQTGESPDSFFDVFFDVFTVDSFFDILAPLQDFNERSGGADSFFDIFVEVDVFNDQQCPPGKVMTGIDSIGNIICDDLPLVDACANGCSGHGQCVGGNLCECEEGYGGFDCSVPPEPTCPSDCSGHGTCVEDGICQCDTGFGGVDCSVPTPSCQPGEIQCSNSCVDPQTDPNNCGQCGNACSGGVNASPMCNGGVCELVCDPGFIKDSTGQCVLFDSDGDGYGSDVDCDDLNPNVNPGALEICNGVDDNCNGLVDETDPSQGSSCSTGQLGVCSQGALACTNGKLSCQQTVMSSPEICDNLDNDCDGTVDDDGICAAEIPADLQVTKTVVGSGSSQSFAFTVSNLGPFTANDITVTETLSSDARIVSLTDSNTGQNISCNFSGDRKVWTCDIDSIKSGNSRTFDVNILLLSSQPTLTNTVSVIASPDNDPNLANNESTATIP